MLIAAACGGSDAGAVHVVWQARDGGPVRLQLKGNDTYQTEVIVRNATRETLRDARLHLKQHNPMLGIEIAGTVTNTRTQHGYDGDYWLIGDLRPGAEPVFPHWPVDRDDAPANQRLRPRPDDRARQP